MTIDSSPTILKIHINTYTDQKEIKTNENKVPKTTREQSTFT